ncbi:hypothetical protein [Amycolatopsis sp. NPDC051071]|uniref:hypothetical protein n=1 Tax=Amycolatopsis sp. NPDC051071 TaxID=3154637 RepID=UPI003441B445
MAVSGGTDPRGPCGDHPFTVLAELPPETTRLGERTQLCVPVAKNGVLPPRGILDYVRWVDLSCYRIDGGAANFPLKRARSGLPDRTTDCVDFGALDEPRSTQSRLSGPVRPESPEQVMNGPFTP